jgi:hypothetical protein
MSSAPYYTGDVRGGGGGGGLIINDNIPSTATTYSSDKVETLVADVKAAHLQINDATPSTTTTYSGDKIDALISAADAGHLEIDDATSTYTKTYSSNKINQLVNDSISTSLNGSKFFSVRVPARDYADPENNNGGKIVFEDEYIQIRYLADASALPQGTIRMRTKQTNDYQIKSFVYANGTNAGAWKNLTTTLTDVFTNSSTGDQVYHFHGIIDPWAAASRGVYIFTYSGSDQVASFTIQKFSPLYVSA